jgi:hypothetical protein
VPRHDGEAVTLTADALVLVERHEDDCVAAAVLSALALELELMLGRRQTVACSSRAALLVHGSNEAFVPSLSFKPLLHRDRRLTADLSR